MPRFFDSYADALMRCLMLRASDDAACCSAYADAMIDVYITDAAYIDAAVRCCHAAP